MLTQVVMPAPHRGQLELLKESGNIVCFAGRRWGKTQLGIIKLILEATKDAGLYWWVGLSWRSASLKRAWRLLKYYISKIWKALGHNPRKYIKESVHEIKLPNGSEIWMRTAEKEDSLAGEAIKGAVVDEFTLMKEIVWTEYLQATLIDYQGWVWFFGIPKGEGWHATLWRNARDWAGWAQYQFSSYDNPTVKNLKETLDDIRLQVTERIFDQEYLAKILPDGGAVFRNLQAFFLPKGTIIEPREHRIYVVGVDWGKENDWTVFTVWDVEAKQIVHIERFNQISWTLQRKRLNVLNHRWRPEIIVAESNAMGVMIEDLQADGLKVIPFQTTEVTKRNAVERLAIDIEHGRVQSIYTPDIENEFQAFAVTKSPRSNTWRYSAPEGYHDDIVMSAVIGYSQVVSSGIQVF